MDLAVARWAREHGFDRSVLCPVFCRTASSSVMNTQIMDPSAKDVIWGEPALRAGGGA